MSRWARIMNEHWTQKGEKMVAKLQFKTLNDAIIAEYVLLKYGKIREKGRMY